MVDALPKCNMHALCPVHADDKDASVAFGEQ